MGAGSDFAPNPNIIRDNGRFGVALEDSVALLAFAVITGNGNGGGVSGGVAVEHGSVRLCGAEITGNNGHGISLRNESFAGFFCGSNISNNSRNGLVLILLSTARIVGPTTISGNMSVDVFCDSSAILQDRSPSRIIGATTVICPNQVVEFGPIP